ncbi:hypothetical protein B0H14DRAFT_2595427 [Mycena olivaceomarginata]|nr:hypothetical protein B0H14DRAFT_2595427 [Mycena olivaceomarginata]
MIAYGNDNRGSQAVKGCCQPKAKERRWSMVVIGQSEKKEVGRKKDAGEQKERIGTNDDDLTWVDPRTRQNQKKHQNWGGTTGKARDSEPQQRRLGLTMESESE